MKIGHQEYGRSRERLTYFRAGCRGWICALCLALSIVAVEAQAVITVTNLNDSGAGSLRQAIADAAPGENIDFLVTGTITLTGGQLAINKSLKINGPGAADLTVSGNNASRVFSISGGTVTVSGLTISGGNATNGGGIYNNGGSVTVSNCIITGNAATSYGGGVMSETTATIVNSAVENNTASQGGGLFNGGAGTMTVQGSTISGNSSTGGGGGIRSYGTLHVSSATVVAGNTSSITGGGINSSGTFTLTNSSIRGNTAENSGGGIATSGTLAMTGSTVSGNTTIFASNGAGGGIFVAGGTANIAASTISGNSAPWGGGIYTSAGATSINNTTVASNAANYGAGIGNGSGGTTAIGNSILANYTSQSDCSGTITSNDYNLIQHSFYAYCTIEGTKTHNIMGEVAVLGLLQDNGGPTETQALLSGSPAIDHGSCAAGTDQRDLIRPAGGGCDIGAFEVSTVKNVAVTKAGPGSGTIDSNTIDGIHCGAACSSAFGEGTGLTLAATADPGSVFMGWSSGSGPASGCTGTGTCIFVVSEDASVTANFKLTQTISVTQSAPATALAGDSFQVEATASSGLAVAITTSGVCTGSGTGSATITMSGTAGDCAVHYNQAGDATYEPAPETVEHTGTGKCSVTVGRTSANGAWSGGVWAPSGPGSTVAASEIEALLDAGTPATITTVVAPGGTICDTDDITVAADITSTHASPSLAFNMAGDFNLVDGARITFPGASPSLSIGGAAYTIINDLNALQNMSANLSGHYALVSDIDASATAGWNGGEGFVPVGTSVARFTGVFDGLGHTIDGLSINRGSSNYQGLFGYVDKAVLRNVGLTDAAVTGQTYVGSLTGYADAGAVINCHADAALSCNSSCGGLIGYSNNGTISRSRASGSVSATGNIVGGIAGFSKGTLDNSHADSGVHGADDVGGLAGMVGGTVSNSYTIGNVSGTNGVGGLVGSSISGRGVTPGAVSSCYASGSVTGTSNVGGLAGAGVTVTNSYWDTETTGRATSAGGGSGLTTAQMMTQGTMAGFDFENTWWMSDGNTRPFLRSEYSIHIGNAHQLQLMALDKSASYTLDRDIDLASALTNTSGANGSSSALWGSGGFVPVGSVGNPFTGTFDGGGHVISGLAINLPDSDFVGLFGALGGSSALIHDVGLDGGSVTGRDYTGALAGYSNDGNVSEVFSTTAVSGRDNVGGLIGSNDNDAVLTDSYAAGTVTGRYRVGGLAGANTTTSSISRAYAAGSVSGSSDAGGLLGYNDATSAVTHGYWDSDASGQGSGVGVNDAGAAAAPVDISADRYVQASYAGFDFGGSWRIYEGHTYPLLRPFLTPLTVTADNIGATYTGTGYAGELVNPVFSMAGADASGHLFGLAAPYQNAINAGSHLPELWSDQRGYDISYVNAVLMIGKSAQTIESFAPPATAAYGDGPLTLSAEATSGLAVDFSVTSGPGSLSGNQLTITGVGTIYLLASQAGDGNYFAAPNVTASIEVGKAPATVTLGNLSHTYDGTPKAVTVGTDPAGLTVNLTYNGSATAPTAAGSYAVVATVVDDNYAGSASGTLTIGKATATVTLGNLSHLYDGTPKAATASTVPAGLTVTFTYDGSSTLPVAVGSYAVVATVVAANYQGSASGTLEVLDTIAPALTLSTLADGAVTNAALLNVAGSASDAESGLAGVTVNGAATAVAGDGSFSAAVTLTAGANLIEVVASDNAGNESSETRTIHLDSTTPGVTVALPDNSATGTDTLELGGTLDDPAAVVTASVNGGTPLPASRSGNAFSFVLTLPPGVNTIEIVVTDPAGNRTVVKRTVTVDLTAPEVAITEPAADSAIRALPLTIRGNVEDALSEVTLQLTVNGAAVTPTVAGSSFSYELTANQGGSFRIQATASDALGNSASAVRNLLYDPYGDADGNGLVEVADALIVLKMAVGQEIPDLHFDVAPLVDGVPQPDGRINVADALVILRRALGLVNW